MGFKKSRAFGPAVELLRYIGFGTDYLELEGNVSLIHLPSFTDSENRTVASFAPKCLNQKAKNYYR
jgi:hypothetical protein